MKANNKKQTKKLLPWLASISFFAVGAMAIVPMATACSNGGDTPPEPSFDPIDKEAYKLTSKDQLITYGNVDGGGSSNGLKVQKGFDKKSVVLKKENFTEWGGVSGFNVVWEKDWTSIPMDYLEYGESIIENSSSSDTYGDRMFTSSTNVTGAMIVIHNQVGSKGKKGLVFGLNDRLLHSNKGIYLDIGFENVERVSASHKPFADDETPTIKIYINKNRGDKVDDWAKLLNIEPKYITELSPKQI